MCKSDEATLPFSQMISRERAEFFSWVVRHFRVCILTSLQPRLSVTLLKLHSPRDPIKLKLFPIFETCHSVIPNPQMLCQRWWSVCLEISSSPHPLLHLPVTCFEGLSLDGTSTGESGSETFFGCLKTHVLPTLSGKDGRMPPSYVLFSWDHN